MTHVPGDVSELIRVAATIRAERDAVDRVVANLREAIGRHSLPKQNG